MIVQHGIHKQEPISKHRVWERLLRSQDLTILAVSTGLAFLVYGRGLPNRFVAEDFNMMAFTTRDWASVIRYFIEASRVKPLPLVLNKVVYPLFGTDPTGYHLMSIVLHAVCTWCVIRFGALVSKRRGVGLIAGLLFAVYPRHHQTVLWMAANQFVIVTLFGLAGLLCFGRYLQGSRPYYLLAWLFVLLALLTNEVGVAFLLLLPLVEWVLKWPTLREAVVALWDWRTYLKYWPLIVLLAAFLFLTFGGQRFDKLTGNRTYHFTSWGEQVRGWGSFLVYLTFPQIPLRSLDVSPLTVALAVLVTLGLGMALVRGTTVARFLVMWILATLAPFVFFVPFGVSDRYFYLPAVGLCILIAHLGCQLYDIGSLALARWSLAILLIGAYFVSSTVMIQHRISEWRRAGEIAADIVGQVVRTHPIVPPKSTMLFVDPPKMHGQAYVFKGGGLAGAIYLAYGGQLSAPKAYHTRGPEVISFLERAEPVDLPLPGLYVFLYKHGILYDKSNAVSNLEPLGRGMWFR